MSQWNDKDYKLKRGLVPLGIRVPEALRDEIDELAKKAHKTRTDWVVALLEQAVVNG